MHTIVQPLLCLFLHFYQSLSSLSPGGCDVGWHAFEDHCYYFGVLSDATSPALSQCENQSAQLASIWDLDEKQFILDKAWKSEVPRGNFAWLGLYGTSFNKFAWRDGSEFGKDQLQTAGTPDDKTNKCGALMGLGSTAYLDCSMDADAFVCKKALSMVYKQSTMSNMTGGTHFQLFERVWPPRLTAIPSSSYHLAVTTVASETSCAYLCFNVAGCKGFILKCITSTTCSRYNCVLLTSVP